METTENKTVEILNDLLRINNDRIQGYEKAIEETNDLDLKSFFATMADESRTYAQDLTRLIRNYGGDPDRGETTASGKIYRVWMDIKATFTGKDREAILNSCEHGEDAAQTAYREALSTDGVSSEARELISRQQSSLRNSHDLVKKYRDLQNRFDKVF